MRAKEPSPIGPTCQQPCQCVASGEQGRTSLSSTQLVCAGHGTQDHRHGLATGLALELRDFRGDLVREILERNLMGADLIREQERRCSVRESFPRARNRRLVEGLQVPLSRGFELGQGRREATLEYALPPRRKVS